jgi:hypothetical protein
MIESLYHDENGKANHSETGPERTTTTFTSTTTTSKTSQWSNNTSLHTNSNRTTTAITTAPTTNSTALDTLQGALKVTQLSSEVRQQYSNVVSLGVGCSVIPEAPGAFLPRFNQNGHLGCMIVEGVSENVKLKEDSSGLVGNHSSSVIGSRTVGEGNNLNNNYNNNNNNKKKIESSSIARGGELQSHGVSTAYDTEKDGGVEMVQEYHVEPTSPPPGYSTVASETNSQEKLAVPNFESGQPSLQSITNRNDNENQNLTPQEEHSLYTHIPVWDVASMLLIESQEMYVSIGNFWPFNVVHCLTPLVAVTIDWAYGKVS